MIEAGFVPDKVDVIDEDPIVYVKSLYKTADKQNMAAVIHFDKGLAHITIDELVDKASKRVLKLCLDE